MTRRKPVAIGVLVVGVAWVIGSILVQSISPSPYQPQWAKRALGWALAPVKMVWTDEAHANDGAYLVSRWERRSDAWVRTSDTMCAAVAETLTGPSMLIWGATNAMFRVQANSGTCSLITLQVSQNDTIWKAAVTTNNVLVRYSQGGTSMTIDSLNQGGVFAYLYTDDANANSEVRQVIPWRYARCFVTTRTGYTATTASSGPTVACRTRLDSLRITGFVQRTAP